jgi:hypothetical protein
MVQTKRRSANRNDQPALALFFLFLGGLPLLCFRLD